MIFITPSNSGELGAVTAINSAGSALEGKLSLEPYGSGQTKFIPDYPERAEEFYAEEREHAPKQEGG